MDAAPPPLLGCLEFALYADDLDASVAFWRDVIGLEEIARQAGRHIFFRAGQQILLIFNAKATREPPSPQARLPVPPHGTTGPGHFCLAISPESFEPWRQHLERHGIAIEADFLWPQGGRSLYIRDPAGNSIELADPAIWASA